MDARWIPGAIPPRHQRRAAGDAARRPRRHRRARDARQWPHRGQSAGSRHRRRRRGQSRGDRAAGESARGAQGQACGFSPASPRGSSRSPSTAIRQSSAKRCASADRCDRRRIEMTARIIDGKIIAAELRARVADEVARVKREHGLTPGLAVVLVGNDPGEPGLCPQQAQADPGRRHGVVRARAAGRRRAGRSAGADRKAQSRSRRARHPGAAAAAEIAATPKPSSTPSIPPRTSTGCIRTMPAASPADLPRCRPARRSAASS